MDIHIELQDTEVRFSLFASSTYELTFGGLSVHMSADQFQQLCDNLRPWVVDDTTPQPAAADGGVRERAREIFARQLESEGYYIGLIEQVRTNNVGTYEQTILAAIEAALSSHRQAGECDISGIIEGQFNDDGDLTNRVDWRVFRDDDGYIWLTTDDPAKDHLLYLDDESAAPPPGADLSKFRELAEGWRSDKPDDAHSTSLWDQGFAHGRNECADELLALVEKGAGS